MASDKIRFPTLSQLDAAGRLHELLEQWRVTDAALVALRGSLPGFDSAACLLKAVAVNALYGTQVLAIARMAKHVEEVLRNKPIADFSPETVEAIAALPATDDGRSRHFISFAAKFCHFFIDDTRFPIYDDAARDMLRYHLGKADYPGDQKHPYIAFCRAFETFRAKAGLTAVSTRDLDRYLWITGMYRRWLRERVKKKPKLNVELRKLFDRPSKAAADALDTALPPGFERLFTVR